MSAEAEEKAIKKTDMLKVRLDAIDVEEGFNVREDYGDIEGLAKQIASQGQKQPLKGVRNGERITLTAGHRRFEAMKIANEKFGANIQYALVITEKVDDKARVLEMLIDGEGSKPLTNSEMVKGITRLLEMGVSKKEIVDSLGMGLSQAQKYNLVKAAEAPKAIQKMIEEGVISAAKVNALQRETTSDEELVEAAQKFVEEKKTEKEQPRQPRVKKQGVVELLEEAIELADPTSPKVANLKAIVRKLKSGASAEDIATLLK
jgi:ParB/RepB/Spo0J family partition protein